MRCATLMLTAVFTAGCGSLQRAGSPETAPSRGSALPRLFDASSVYRSMGALVGGGALPFVGSVRYLAGPTPDSTLALFSVSLTNQTLTFQRRGSEFVAEYHVEVSFRTDSTSLTAIRQIGSDEIKVGGLIETQFAGSDVGAKARFADENAKGGVNGRKITYVEGQTYAQGNTAAALAEGQRLVQQEGVAAIVPAWYLRRARSADVSR